MAAVAQKQQLFVGKLSGRCVRREAGRLHKVGPARVVSGVESAAAKESGGMAGRRHEAGLVWERPAGLGKGLFK